MKVLVTGANGFLGRSVVGALMARGHQVRIMVRGRAKPQGHNDAVEAVCADLLEPSSLADAVTGVDAVIHLAFDMRAAPAVMLRTAVDGTVNLIRAMRPECSHLVLASSFSVYDWSQVGDRLTENSPRLTQALAPTLGPYAQAKWQQEASAISLCEQHRISLTVLRPAMIWGPEHPGMDMVGPGHRRLRLVVKPQRRLHLTYVENCADAFALALDKRAPFAVFNVEDGFKVSATQFAAALQPGAQQCALPEWTLKFLALVGPLARWCLNRGMKVPGLLIPERWAARFPEAGIDASAARHDLGWSPCHPLDAAILRTVEQVRFSQPN